ncbi:MAG: asparaginase, partial [Nitrospirota bacterium]
MVDLQGLRTEGTRRQMRGQQKSLRMVAMWAGIDESAVGVAVDGCGVPVFALPLVNMALSYARLVSAAA